MPALVVVLVSDCCKSAYAVPTLVGLFSCVDSHVYEQVASLIKVFLAPHALEETVT